MTQRLSAQRKRPLRAGVGTRVLVLVALFAVSINLRPTVTTVAAAMPEIGEGFGLAPHLMPLLGTMPVVAFGISAPLGPWLGRPFGARAAVAIALLVLTGALLIRALVPGLLLPGTFLAGSAIMTASVLVPQILKTNGGNGWWTGLCTMGFGLGAAMGAGLVRPLEQLLGGSLPWALAVWAAPALLAAGLIRPRGRSRTHAGTKLAPPARNRLIWRQRTALAVAAFFGLQALLYFAVTSWLAAFLVSRGIEAADAAGMLAWFSIAGLPASLLSPVLASRPAILKIITPGLGMLIAAGLLGVLAAPAGLQFWAVGLLGAVQSAGFGLGMALMVIRSNGPQSAGRLSAMSQGSGFALASLGPLLAGILQQLTGGWETSFWVLAGGALLLAVAGRFAVTGPGVGIPGEAASRSEEAGMPLVAELAAAGPAVETAEPAKGS